MWSQHNIAGRLKRPVTANLLRPKNTPTSWRTAAAAAAAAAAAPVAFAASAAAASRSAVPVASSASDTPTVNARVSIAHAARRAHHHPRHRPHVLGGAYTCACVFACVPREGLGTCLHLLLLHPSLRHRHGTYATRVRRHRMRRAPWDPYSTRRKIGLLKNLIVIECIAANAG